MLLREEAEAMHYQTTTLLSKRGSSQRFREGRRHLARLPSNCHWPPA